MTVRRGREKNGAGGGEAVKAHGNGAGGPAHGEDFGESLEEIFAGELRECLQLVPPQLDLLRSPATHAVACRELQRVFHTIKGSAGLVGRADLARAALALERLFTRPASVSPATLTRAHAAMRRLFDAAGLEPPARPVAAEASAAAPEGAPDPELLQAFGIDASEALERCEDLLFRLEETPDDGAALAEIFRRLHTVKGSAAAVGLSEIATRAHEAESIVEAALAGREPGGEAGWVEGLLRQADVLKGLVAAAVGAEPEPAADRRLGGADATPAGGRAAEGEAVLARVPTAVLDALLDQASQLVVNRVQMEQKIRSFADLREKLHSCRRRLEETAQLFDRRLEDRLWEEPDAPRPVLDDRFFTELEFDKYDDITVLSRSVIEAASDAGEIADELGRLIDRLGDQARHFSKLTTSMQREVAELRRVPIDVTFRRLRRSVREAARRAGKIVDLKLRGGDVTLDRAVVDALHAPLLHLVRNAVAHGIEAPAERSARGKPQIGLVAVRATHEPEGVRIEVEDDGAGIDANAVIARGRALGLALGPDATREQIASALLHPGFTTRGEPSELCGRGVGLDAVARDLAMLNGAVRIDFGPGRGTKVELLVPVSTSIDEALLVDCGSQVLGVSLRSVECALPVEMNGLNGARRPSIRLAEGDVPVVVLAELLGEAAPADGAVAVVLRAPEGRLALLVDRVRAQQDLAVRPLDALLSAHPLLRGTAISGTGAVVFLLDPAGLAAHASGRLGAERAEDEEERAARDEAANAVLVVDDSISVRRLAARFLEGEGIEVETAVDGLDAIEKLAHDRFRVVVTDLEMPRLHGYELIETMRRHPRWCRIPIIVCTSRSSAKHREKAREMGASGYVTKPFTKEELVGEVTRLWPRPAPPRAAAPAAGGLPDWSGANE